MGLYCVVKTMTRVGSVTEATGISIPSVYYCKTKKLACAYLEKRYNASLNSIKRQEKINASEIELINCGINSDKTWCNIEYNEKNLTGEPGYFHTQEEMRIVRAQEILDLPNGPALHVE